MLASNHKRMARNTAMLYMRMLLAMAVTLYTSRVVLHVLGIEDFGIYQVVTGFVALLGFLQGAMTTATQRFLAFDLGESGGQSMSRIFNTSVLIHALLAVCIALLAETAGYWFVSTQLIIPDERISAALSAYHLAIISYVISVLMVPFTAMLMAHERMGIFAGIGMLDVILKLVTVITLKYIDSDKLVAYAWLLLAVSLTTFMLYLIASKLLFPKIRLRCEWHPKQFKTMLSYTAWNTWGNLAAALSGQGTNVLLNIFFGPTINAGRSIALQANGALYSFVQNIQSAINPQIIKLYASGNMAQMHNLILRASKYNFFLLLTLALPVLLNTEILLGLWLVEVPPHAIEFIKLTIIASLIDSISGPLMTSAQATGRIRLYHTVVGGILLLNLPVGYFFLAQGHQPEAILLVAIALCVLALIARIIIAGNLIKISKTTFILRSLARPLLVATVSSMATMLIQENKQPSLQNTAISLATPISVTIITIWFFGLDSTEKSYLFNIAKKLINRFYSADNNIKNNNHK